MRRRARIRAAWGLGLALAICAAATAAPQPGGAGDATRELMREIFAQIRVLLPRVASRARLTAPDDAAEVHGALQRLATGADALAEHTRPRDPALRHLGASLARDAREALRAWERGRADTAAFLVTGLTENCIACHARLPSPGDSPTAASFIDDPRLAGLPLVDRVQIELATRRFDAALADLEALILDPELRPAELLGPIADHLTVAIRVKRDPARAVQMLERFAQRPDLRRHLRLDVEHWIASLRALAGDAQAPPSLARARALLEEARAQIRFPADRRALAHYVVASSALHRLAAAPGLAPLERAEVFYRLGVVESRIGRNEWVSQAGTFLEAAIRLAPQSAFAETAYAVLEEETLLDYADGTGAPLPPDVAAHLAELERLLDAR